jgi:hypothetical protein
MATYYVDGAVGNDSNAGTSAGSGNAWATISKALSVAVGGDRVWVKASATYSISTGLTGGGAAYNSHVRYEAYTSTTGDGGRATIQATAAITMWSATSDGYEVVGFIFDGNSVSTKFASTSGTFGGSLFARCKFINGASSAYAFTLQAGTTMIGCEVGGTTSTTGLLQDSGGSMFRGNYFHDNAAPWIVKATGTGGLGFFGNVLDTNAGANRDGLVLDSVYRPHIVGNTFYGQGRHGVSFAGFWTPAGYTLMNNIFVSCGGYGVSNGGGYGPGWASEAVDYNAFYNNTSGARNGLTAGAHDVTLSADPFTDAANGDFSLNSTSGGGAALKGMGFPATFPVT